MSEVPSCSFELISSEDFAAPNRRRCSKRMRTVCKVDNVASDVRCILEHFVIGFVSIELGGNRFLKRACKILSC